MIRKIAIMIGLFFTLILIIPENIAAAYVKITGYQNNVAHPFIKSLSNQTGAVPPILFPIIMNSLPPAEMISIPAGEFKMGCDPNHNDSYSCYYWQLPKHAVWLSAFHIDKLEVTNTYYAECVRVGVCSAPWSDASATRTNYYNDPAYGDYPVIYVSWDDAHDYCAWRDKRLPTEAE